MNEMKGTYSLRNEHEVLTKQFMYIYIPLDAIKDIHTVMYYSYSMWYSLLYKHTYNSRYRVLIFYAYNKYNRFMIKNNLVESVYKYDFHLYLQCLLLAKQLVDWSTFSHVVFILMKDTKMIRTTVFLFDMKWLVIYFLFYFFRATLSLCR